MMKPVIAWENFDIKWWNELPRFFLTLTIRASRCVTASWPPVQRMGSLQHPTDGDTRRCPQCRDTLVFSSRYPVLSAGLTLTQPRSSGPDPVRYEPAWVCRNGGCDYRELMGDA
jgi:hypothetical protein